MADYVLETYEGRKVDLMAPAEEDICLTDIAWGLSRIARFNGHTLGPRPYSVAQHSLWCSWAAQHLLGASSLTARHVLLHDAHEAYSGDIVRPLKSALKNAGLIEQRLQASIYRALDMPPPSDVDELCIGECDHMALAVEAHHLVRSNGRGWFCMHDISHAVLAHFWEPEDSGCVYVRFLNAWNDLKHERDLPEDLCEVGR